MCLLPLFHPKITMLDILSTKMKELLVILDSILTFTFQFVNWLKIKARYPLYFGPCQEKKCLYSLCFEFSH